MTVWPAALYAALVLVLAGLILTASWLLGERQYHGSDAEQYESGIKPAGPLPQRLSVEFYQIALFFVIFDLEAVFIFSWAVSARQLGWLGYFELLFFVLLLFAGLVYLWKAGAKAQPVQAAAQSAGPAAGAPDGAAAAGGPAGGAR